MQVAGRSEGGVVYVESVDYVGRRGGGKGFNKESALVHRSTVSRHQCSVFLSNRGIAVKASKVWGS